MDDTPFNLTLECHPIFSNRSYHKLVARTIIDKSLYDKIHTWGSLKSDDVESLVNQFHSQDARTFLRFLTAGLSRFRGNEEVYGAAKDIIDRAIMAEESGLSKKANVLIPNNISSTPIESLEEFVRRLSESIGCFYHFTPAGFFILKKTNTNDRGKMGVIAKVLELKRTGRFRIDIKKEIAEKANVSELADEGKPNLMWGRPGLCFFVQKGSNSNDYKKTVRALTAIIPLS